MSVVLPLLSRGDFADVFDLGDGRVLRAFRDTPSAVIPHADRRLAPTISFAAEFRAYERLQSLPTLERWVPRFFGAADPRDYSLDSSSTFESGSGILLERIPGVDRKLFALEPAVLAQAEAILDSMKEQVGIRDPWDGSAFVPGTRALVTLIDFATPTDELVALDAILVRDGDISDDSARLLGIVEAKARW